MIDGYIAVEREDARKFCPHHDVTVSNKFQSQENIEVFKLATHDDTISESQILIDMVINTHRRSASIVSS